MTRARSTARTVALATVGCKLNQYETEGMAEALERAGYVVVPFDGAAEVYIVNTCTVTGRSDYRSRAMLRRASRRTPGALIVATGCYAQRDPDGVTALPDVSLVVGNGGKGRIVQAIETVLRDRPAAGAALRTGLDDSRAFEALDIERFRGYTRAFLKIQDGCDARCTYCAVPGARGPARSRPRQDVLLQAERLVANGYSEIVLTGVHIGAYGSDRGGAELSDLLRDLADVPGLERIRLGSVEPTELGPALASAMLTLDCVAPHLHVPLESGSDSVLERMARGYGRDDYARAVHRVTDHAPLCGLGADVMVGFPGETDEEFADTVEVIESLPFTYLHVFAFSPRPRTPAALMKDDVPGSEKRRRSRHLRELGRRKSLAFRRRLVGSTLRVLVEERSDPAPGVVSGLSGNYVRVELPGGDALRNRFVDVAVLGADADRTWGTAVGRE